MPRPLEPLFSRTVRGTLFLPASNPACANSVVLLLHGLSYGAWAWDFPLDNATYSMARAIASAGYPAATVDELGYGASDHPNGWNLTAQSYGAITAQMVSALRSGRYTASAARAFQRVILFGHSAGTEMSELAAGNYRGVDGLIAGAYSHFPSTGILVSVLTQDSVAITAPVLLVLAEHDALFPPEFLGISYAQLELALFTAAFDRSLYIVPAAGHTFMLHPNAPQTQKVITDWLGERYPTCNR